MLFVYSLFAVFGVAILTAIYFGILGTAFLRFRKFWRRSEADANEPNEADRPKQVRANH